MITGRQRIWIIGAGAVGSALAALLAEKADVTLVGNSPHAVAVRENGLRVGLYGEDEKVLSLKVLFSHEMPPLQPDDWVFLAGKIWSLAETAEWLKHLIHPGQWIVALQNGMGFESELEKGLGIQIQRGIVQFGSNSAGQGDVRFYRGRLILAQSAQADTLKTWLADREVVCEVAADFLHAQWHKLLINCVANPLAGLLRLNNQAVGHPDLDGVKKHLLTEVQAVAAAEGVRLDISLDQLNAYFRSENVPSLVRDLERGKPTEVAYINGYVVAKGREHGIAAPANESLAVMIEYLSKQTLEG